MPISKLSAVICIVCIFAVGVGSIAGSVLRFVLVLLLIHRVVCVVSIAVVAAVVGIAVVVTVV